jgi:hypothetical protein
MRAGFGSNVVAMPAATPPVRLRFTIRDLLLACQICNRRPITLVKIAGGVVTMWGMDDAIDLFRRNISENVLSEIPFDVVLDDLVIPVELDYGTLVVAMVDPDDYDKIEKLRFIVNRNIEPRRATVAAIEFAIRRYYSEPPKTTGLDDWTDQ